MATVTFETTFDDSPALLQDDTTGSGPDEYTGTAADYAYDIAGDRVGSSNGNWRLQNFSGAGFDDNFSFTISSFSDTPGPHTKEQCNWWHIRPTAPDPYPSSADRPFSEVVRAGDTIEISMKAYHGVLASGGNPSEIGIYVGEYDTNGNLVEEFFLDGDFLPADEDGGDVWIDLSATHTVENTGFVTVGGYNEMALSSSTVTGWTYDNVSIVYTLNPPPAQTLWIYNRGFRFPYPRWT